MKQTSIFISCRFHNEDQAVIEWFEKKLKSFGLSTYIAKSPEARTPPEKVRASILERDLLAAIITKTPSPWIHNEIGMAYALGKPIIGFFEAGVHNKGLYPYIGDYLEFDRQDLDKSTNDTIHLANSVLREWDSDRLLDQLGTHQVKLISQRELSELLPTEIRGSNTMELFLYTAETFLEANIHEALQRNKQLQGRILIREPSADERKYPMAQASLNYLKSLGHPSLIIGHYCQEPLLRAMIFDQCRGYVGLYRWVPESHFQFIGAEDNALAVVTKDSGFGRLWLELYLSRFEHEWQKWLSDSGQRTAQ